jgi:hypothetical protein
MPASKLPSGWAELPAHGKFLVHSSASNLATPQNYGGLDLLELKVIMSQEIMESWVDY